MELFHEQNRIDPINNKKQQEEIDRANFFGDGFTGKDQPPLPQEKKK